MKTEAWFNGMTGSLSVRVDIETISISDRVDIAQNILRKLVLPQTTGEVCCAICTTDPALRDALDRVWEALNKAKEAR